MTNFCLLFEGGAVLLDGLETEVAEDSKGVVVVVADVVE